MFICLNEINDLYACNIPQSSFSSKIQITVTSRMLPSQAGATRVCEGLTLNINIPPYNVKHSPLVKRLVTISPAHFHISAALEGIEFNFLE